MAVVELDKGPRVVTSIDGVDEADLRIDLPVRAAFDDVDDELTLLRLVRA